MTYPRGSLLESKYTACTLARINDLFKLDRDIGFSASRRLPGPCACLVCAALSARASRAVFSRALASVWSLASRLRLFFSLSFLLGSLEPLSLALLFGSLLLILLALPVLKVASHSHEVTSLRYFVTPFSASLSAMISCNVFCFTLRSRP